MSVKIRKHLVSKDVASRVTYGGRNPINYIVIHETANTNRGADADAHGRLQANGNSRSASWHYTVDDKEAVQSFDDRAQCWHAGSRKYNEQSIGIEICVNEGGNFRKAVENAAELTRQLMRKYNVPTSRVIQHNQASGKDCPRYLRNGSKGVNWTDFKRLIDGKTNSKPTSKKPSKSVKTTNKTVSQMAREVAAGKHGNGHENRRKSLGVDEATYAKVKAEVNHMLTGKGASKAKKKRTTSQSISQMATRIINDEKAPRGHAARQRWLGVDNATYQKVRAEVNRRMK